MKKFLKINLFIVLSICFAGCQEHKITPLSEGERPEKVSDVTVESLPGAARISYKIPLSNDFLYAKIVYEPRAGIVRTIKSSLYERSILLEGFSKEGKYPIKIYSVAKGEVESEPLSSEITVSEPAYLTAFKHLKVTSYFGGIRVLFSNEDNQQIGVNISSYNEKARSYRLDNTYYSKIKDDVDFKSTGYDVKPIKYAITTFDRFGNISDTLFTEVTPLQEFLADKSLFRSLPLPPHNNAGYNSYCLIDNLWDNEVGDNLSGTAYMTRTSTINTTTGVGVDFAIDIGKAMKLNRFKLFHPHTILASGSATYYSFSSYTPQLFEIWGSNNPNLNGSWDSWTKIDDFVSKKPDGLSVADQRKYASIDGEDYYFPADVSSYRYYRFKVNKTWGNNTYTCIDELTFWGGEIN